VLCPELLVRDIFVLSSAVTPLVVVEAEATVLTKELGNFEKSAFFQFPSMGLKEVDGEGILCVCYACKSSGNPSLLGNRRWKRLTGIRRNARRQRSALK
jgi:hypothetical protein